MRVLGVAAIAAAAALALAAAVPAAKKPAPAAKLTGSVQVVFSGHGEERYTQYRQWIYQINSKCWYDKTVSNTGTFSWTSTWAKVPLASFAKGISGRPATTSQPGGAVTGQEVRGDCGALEPLEGWAVTIACNEGFVFGDGGWLDVGALGKDAVVVDAQAPRFEMNTPTQCALKPRNSQLTVSTKVSLKALAKLKRGQSLAVPVGTHAPNSLVPYAPDYNCEQSEPPYEGVQIEDECMDRLVWSGTLTITKL